MSTKIQNDIQNKNINKDKTKAAIDWKFIPFITQHPDSLVA
jgi:hypothetical protein